jgi:hypothetical protein
MAMTFWLPETEAALAEVEKRYWISIEVLDKMIDLLRSRGRMSYRALQQQFHLDDSFIDDLKEEPTPSGC